MSTDYILPILLTKKALHCTTLQFSAMQYSAHCSMFHINLPAHYIEENKIFTKVLL